MTNAYLIKGPTFAFTAVLIFFTATFDFTASRSVSFDKSAYSAYENDTTVMPMLILSSKLMDKDITIRVKSENDTATVGSDYMPGSFNVTFTAGENSTKFSVSIVNDMMLENDEKFRLVIDNSSLPDGVTIGNHGTTVVTILNDDVLDIQFTSKSFNGSESSGEVSLTLTLSGVSSINISVSISLSQITATDDDFNTSSLNATIFAGATTTKVRVAVTSDDIVEGDEMFNMSLNVPSSLGPGVVAGSVTSATGIIIDSSIIRLGFSHAQYNGSEATGLAIVTLELDGGTSSNPFNVTVTPSEQSPPVSAEGGVDFNTTTLTATFDSGMTMSSVNVSVIDDDIVERDETFVVMLSLNGNKGIKIGGRDDAVVTIKDSSAIKVRFTETQYTVTEASEFVIVTLELVGGTSSYPFNVTVTPSEQLPASAAGSVDFNTTTLTATFDSGMTMSIVNVSVIDDDIVERNETFVVMLSLNGNKGIKIGGRDDAVVTIKDSSAIKVRFTETQYTVTEASEFVIVTLELVGGTSSYPFNVTVTPSEQLPASAAGGVDFNTTTLTATFDSGMTMSIVNVSVIDDDIVERDETFVVMLSLNGNEGIKIGGRDDAVVNIKDSSAIKVRFTETQYTVTEASEFVIVTLELVGGTSSYPFNVTVTPSEQSPALAAGGIDFDTTTLTATFDSGINISNVSVPVKADKIVEKDEVFEITLSIPAMVNSGIKAGNRSKVEVTIKDSTVTVGFTSDQYNGSEVSRFVEVVVKISDVSNFPVTIAIAPMLLPMSATNDDFNSTSFNITINAGNMYGRANVTLKCDKKMEGIESFNFSLAVMGNNPLLAVVKNTTTVQILDIIVNFNQQSYNVMESNKMVTMMIVLTQPSPQPLVVNINSMDKNEMMSITVPAGEVTQSFTVGIIDDDVAECSETFNVTMSIESCGFTIGNNKTGEVMIRDNDRVNVSLAQSKYSVAENSKTLMVDITMNVTASEDVEVDVIFSNGSAKAGEDYTSLTSHVSISAGSTSSSFSIDITNDLIQEDNETFNIEIKLLPNCVSLLLGISSSTVTIIDNDVAEIQFASPTFNGSESSEMLSVTIIILGGVTSSKDIDITLMFTGDKSDFNSTDKTTKIVAGTNNSVVNIEVIADSIVEGNETFSINLNVSSPLGRGVIVGSVTNATGIIIDSSTIKVKFTEGKYTGSEIVGFVMVTLELKEGTSSNPFNVTVIPSEQSPVSAEGGVDFDNATLTATFDSMTKTSSVMISIMADSIFEGDEFFNINLELPSFISKGITLGRNKVKVTITDSTNIGVKFAHTQYTGSEAKGFVVITLELVNGTSSDPFNITVTPLEQPSASAKGGVDFNTTTLTATFDSGMTMSSVNVTIINDDVVEGDEIFVVILSLNHKKGINIDGEDNAVVNIVDSTAISVRFTKEQYSGTEATRVVMVALKINGTSSYPFNVTVTPSEQSPVSAEGGVDFDNTTLTTTFDNGMTMSSVSVPVIDDMLAEGQNETFDLMLTVPSSFGPAITADGRNRATGVIIDTTMLVVKFESERYTGSESSGFVEVVVIISGGSSTTPISVMITISNRSATGSGVDFDSSPINITFAAGEVSKSVNVPVMCDKIASEGKERFDISLLQTSKYSQVTSSKDKSVGVIQDSTVVVNFKRSTYEVMEDGGEVVIMIELSQASSESFEVMISLMDDATNDEVDYSSPSSIVVPPNVTSETLTININNDGVSECDESFKLTLSVPSSTCGVVSGRTDATEVTIKDDDGALLSFNQSQYSIEENITPLSVGLMLSRRASKDVIVEITITNGSAKAGIDYGNSSQSLVYNVTITAGMTSSSFDVDIIDNVKQDGNKMFNITIRLISTCFTIPTTIISNTAVVTIKDNEVTNIEFSSTNFTGSELSGEIIVTVLATGAISDNKINVMVTLTKGTAKGNDFSTSPLTATIPAGATNTTVRVAVTNDDIVEGDEMFSMSLNVPSSLGPGVVAGSVTSATGIIIDSSTIRVRFTHTQYTGSEATGFAMVTLELVGGTSSNPFNVTVTPSEQSPVSAEGGVDFDTTTLTATFDSGMTMSSVSVPVIDDMLAEGQNETFNLILTVPSSRGPAITAGSGNRATGVINDTTMLVVEFESGQYTGSESSRFVEVVVIISGGSSTTPISVMITITTAGQSASRSDLGTAPIVLTFAPSEINKTANIPITCDKRSENEERFNISLTLTSNNPQVRTGRDRSVGIIRDSTVVVNFKQSSYGVMEDGGEVMIMIELSQPSSEPFEVMISLMGDATAERTKDYQRQSNSIMVAANETSTSFNISLINNDVSECDEKFKLTLTVPSSTCGVVSGKTDTTEVTIKDDDGALLSFNQSRYSIEENITPLSVGLMLSRRTSKDVIVEVTITDGSAKAGIDYGNSSQSLVYNVTITAGMTSSSFDVDIIDNMIQDGDKTFNISFRLISTCLPVTIGSNTTSIAIIDDEVLRVQFMSDAFSGLESSNEILITVVIVGGTPEKKNVSALIRFLELTANGSDFNTSSLTATIPAGATNTTVRVAVTSDDIVEGDEMFSMSLNVPSSLGPGVVAGSVTSATGIIIDSSTIRVRFTHTQYTGSEATGFAMVTLELVGGTSSNPFNVTVTPSEQSPVSAEGGVDFDTTTLTATFDSGMTMSSVNVSVIDDKLLEGQNETFDLMLIVPSSLGPAIRAGGRNRATGIINDTTMLVVEFESGQYTGSESSGFVEVVVIISGGSSTIPISVMITITTAGQSASRSDLGTAPIVLTFAPSEINKTANIPITCDKRSENEESFGISLTLTSNNPQVRTGRDKSVGIIRDSTVVVNFNQSLYEVMEDGDEVMIMIDLNQPSSKPFEVMISLMSDNSADGGDYRLANSSAISVAAEEMSKSFTIIIIIINDNITECDENIKLMLSIQGSPCGITTKDKSQTEVIIKDNGAVLSFNQSQYSIEENITPLSVGLMLSRRASKDVIVEVTITDGSAKAGIDYGNSSQSLVYNVTITAGMTSSSFDVDIIDNMIQDGDKTFNISIRLISTCLPVTIGSDTTIVTIIDDEVLKIQFEATNFEGSESSKEISINIVIEGGIPTINISVDVSFLEATAIGDDFNTTTLTATIPAGATNTTVRVAVTNDDIVEGDEMFSMSLNVPSSLGPGVVAGSVTSATGIIIDSSTIRVRFTHTRYTGSEATGFVMVTLELVGGTSSNPFNVTVTPSEQSPVSAEGGVDFDTATLTATFDSGMTMSSVSVPIVNDNIIEGNETLFILLSLLSSVNKGIKVGGRKNVTITIIDSTVGANVISNPVSIIVFKNTIANLSCNATASGPIRYQWNRVNGGISSDRAEGVNTSTLTISPVQQEDEDEYYCVASYGVVNGMDHRDESERAKITVLALQPFDVAHYVIADNSFTLSCGVINDVSLLSNGIIMFEWSKDNMRIDSTNQMIQIDLINSGTSQLVIDKLNPDLHNGEYSCKAIYNNTSLNSASESTSVTIEISNFTQSIVESFEEARNVNETHYSSPVVLPGLNMFNLPINYLFVVLTTNEATIPMEVPDTELVSFTESDRMMYVTTVVRNMSGDQWEKNIVIGNGSNFTLAGKKYYNAPLDKNNTYYIFVRAYAYSHSDSNPRYASSGLSDALEPPPPAKSDDNSGLASIAPIIGVVLVLIIIIIAIIIVIIVLMRYRKKYKKQDGPLSPSAKDDIPLHEKMEKAMPVMNLKSFPVVNLKELQVKTSVGQPTTLYIEAKGNPMPEITWIKDGDPINYPLLQDGSLYIPSTTVSDEGSYTVTAASSEGMSGETIELVVLNPQFVPSNANKKPIKIDRFAEQLAMLHANINKQFSADYDSLVAQTEYSYHAAKLAINVNKNRYKNILAYDHSRVVLSLQDNCSGSDYINASFIDGYNEKKAYIACQGPMASTVADFWRMVWEQNVNTIVMVTNLTEEGKPKCHQYWPDKVNGSFTYGNVSVTFLQEEVFAEYTIRSLALKMIEASSEAKSVSLEVKHFHFTVWPDHGVPKYATAILGFHKRVCKNHKRKRGSPLLVHCSAGVGRTGTFIAIDIELQRIKQEGVVDVFNTVYRLRSRRSFTVQTLAQYVFVFDALMESIMCGDNTIGAPTNVAKERLEELARVNPTTQRSGYELQFQKLQEASPKEDDFQYVNANLPENRHKNRSMKHLPPDSSRVYLSGGYDTDYICANYIDGYRHRKAYLATEGPMESTMVEFWGMIWERKSHAIVMLSHLEENGREICAKYWPNKVGEMKVGKYVIELTSENDWGKYFVRRIMKLKMITGIKESPPRTITQFQYKAWPDHSCPSEASSIMDMVEVLQQVQRKTGNGPITVHCSDGMGRTGTFCAVMMCHDRLKTEHMADVFYAIKTIRAQRPAMVENAEQYKFIHKTLIETMDRLATYSTFN